MRTYEIEFRGETRVVVVDRDYGYEPDTNAHEIEWHFEGVTPIEHDALAVTAEEEAAIHAKLCEYGWDGDDEDGRW